MPPRLSTDFDENVRESIAPPRNVDSMSVAIGKSGQNRLGPTVRSEYGEDKVTIATNNCAAKIHSKLSSDNSKITKETNDQSKAAIPVDT